MPIRALCAAIALLLSALPSSVLAATLSVSPASGSHAVGTNFVATVYAGSPDRALNAYAGTIAFPPGLLQVASLDTTGITSMWVRPPSFSNTTGTISFQGIVVNPGYQGSAGRLLTIHFRAASVGSAKVAFSKSSVLANDGTGSEILTAASGATYALTPAPPTVPVTPAPTPVKVPPKVVKPPACPEVVPPACPVAPPAAVPTALIVTLVLIGMLALAYLLLLLERKHDRSSDDQVIRELERLRQLVRTTSAVLREDVQKQLRFMERAKTSRELTAEEEKVVHHLQRTLDVSERLIEGEVDKAESLARKSKRP